MKHKHHDLIVQWAADTSYTAWIWSDRVESWESISNPSWYEECTYAIGEKPTQPPQKMCVLAGVEFPMPLQEAPNEGDPFFYIDGDGVNESRWDSGTRWKRHALRANIAQATAAGGEAQFNAIQEALKQAIEEAK